MRSEPYSGNKRATGNEIYRRYQVDADWIKAIVDLARRWAVRVWWMGYPVHLGGPTEVS